MAAAKRRGKRFTANMAILYALALPALISVVVFSYAPMYGVQIAFKNFRTSQGIWGSEWVGLAHFAKFLRYPMFGSLLTNTIRLSLYSLLAGTPIPILFALGLNELSSARFRKCVQMISYAPYFLSTVVICGMLKAFGGMSGGLFNTMRAAFGREAIDFLGNASFFPHLYVWSGIWQGAGWSAIIYLAALSGVSQEQIEAALIDGASTMRIIWHVKLPAIRPTIIILLIMSVGGVLGVGFEKVYLLQNPLNLATSEVISTYVYKIGIQSAQFSYSAAIGLFNTLVSVFLMCVVNVVAKKLSGISIW